jgi:hypothetical protein
VNVGTRETKAGALSHLTTLDKLVDYYKATYVYTAGSVWDGVERSENHHDPLVDMCRETKTLLKAIAIAVAGKRRNGKAFSEDSRIFNKVRALMLARLSVRIHQIATAKSFEELYQIIESARCDGCGKLMTYNLTNRIGARLGIKSERFVYLHAGPLKGWKRLTKTRKSPLRVEVEWLPAPLRRLEPHRVEDFLCEFSEFLHPGLMESSDAERIEKGERETSGRVGPPQKAHAVVQGE